MRMDRGQPFEDRRDSGVPEEATLRCALESEGFRFLHASGTSRFRVFSAICATLVS